jgi:adiponectin receptor
MNSTAEKIFEEIKHISFDNIPSYLQFNRRIVRGYRVGYNFRSLFKSLFEWHNETVNAWTHLIGAIIIFFVIFSSNLFTQHYHSKH